MVYYRRRRRRRYRKKRRMTTQPWYSKAYNYGRKALRVAYGLKRILNVEYKATDYNANVTPISGTPYARYLTNIAQGDNFNQRNGNSILAKSVLVKLKAECNVLSETQSIRVLLVKDTQCRGVAPTLTDILQSPTSLISPRNRNTTARFEILADKVFTVAKDLETDTKFLNIFVKLTHHVKFTGATDVVGDAREGALFLYIYTDDAANNADIDIYTRFRYIDN